jgi:hypothetical protein
MGFKDAKRALLRALKNGTYQHYARNDISAKNKLLTGEISVEAVIRIVGKCSGTNHTMSAHHADQSITVHVLKRDGWYIKFYFIDADTWFISVHK